MVIDTRSGRILHSAETDDDLKSRHPYKEWMEKNVRRLVPFEDLPDEEVGSRELDDDTLASYQKQFNYSAEELDSVIRVLGENGQEAVGSMGDDTPIRRALQPAAHYLRLLPPAVCSGNQPANRPAARSACYVARHQYRS